MPNPVIPATDTVNYIFSFPNAGAAGRDLVVGVVRGQEVLLYFPSVSSVVPVAGYQPMVSENGPIDNALFNHPNLLFAIDLALPARRESAILKSVYSEAQMAEIVMVLSNYGLLVDGLSSGPKGYAAEDGVTLYTTEDGVPYFTEV